MELVGASCVRLGRLKVAGDWDQFWNRDGDVTQVVFMENELVRASLTGESGWGPELGCWGKAGGCKVAGIRMFMYLAVFLLGRHLRFP